jgi:hypothetical protein
MRPLGMPSRVYRRGVDSFASAMTNEVSPASWGQPHPLEKGYGSRGSGTLGNPARRPAHVPARRFLCHCLDPRQGSREAFVSNSCRNPPAPIGIAILRVSPDALSPCPGMIAFALRHPGSRLPKLTRLPPTSAHPCLSQSGEFAPRCASPQRRFTRG